ncbi:MAG TPA: PH domain-containing protein [Tepidisphaeraceae bacterium]|jgi:membrane protein YdbS with pleckstrin-like domain
MTNIDPDQVTPPVPAAASVPAADTPHRPPDDVEEVYYEGSPLVRGAIGKGVLWVLAGLILIGLAIAKVVMDLKLPWWATLSLVVVGILFFFVPVLMTKTVRYRVTNYRIDFERGLLSKNIDTLELWHVEDLSFHQSLIDRMLGVGNITVISHDKTMPRLVLASLPNPRHLYEQLKQRVIAVKRQRGVIKMDPG